MSSIPASSLIVHASALRRGVASGVVAFVLLGVSLLTRAAAAQPASKDAAMAETLFEDAKKRMEAGDYASACPKLAESYRLDPGSGTLTALALCHEQLGKTATAWAEFIEVVTDAQQAGRADREKFARKHVSALEPHLSRLTISVVPETARLADVQVKRDHVVVGSAAWGVSSPVDPGEHVVEVTAPGHKAWSARVTIGRDGDKQAVEVPELATAADDSEANSTSGGHDDVPPMVQAVPAPVETAADAGAPAGGGQRVAGWVLGGAGLVSIGAGSFFGIEALNKSRDAKSQCPTTTTCTPVAVEENQDAKTAALVSDVTVGLGLAAVTAGIVLIVTAPSGNAPAAAPAPDAESTSRLRVAPAIGPHVAGLSLAGEF
jgi:hypothetical protein